MKWRPIKTAPKDEDILLLIGGQAIEGSWTDYGAYDTPRFRPVQLDSHGCGCCGGADPDATHWLPLPTHREKKK